MRERTRRALWFCGALVLAGGAGLSAGNAADGPQNSHRAVFGVGWECDWGYRREGNGCAPVDLPENAHITAAGNIWECNRGFRRKGGACAAIDLPEHRSEEHTSELQSLMRISYAVFCLKKKTHEQTHNKHN